MLWWADLPPNTDRVVIYRATSANGPWNRAVEDQITPDRPTGAVDLVDGTLHDLYYRMEALDASGSVLKSYEIVYVPKDPTETLKLQN